MIKKIKISILSLLLSSSAVVSAVTDDEKIGVLPPIISLLLDADSCEDIAAQANTYYVSPNGNDSNSGKSPSSAWRTLSAVQSNADRNIFLPGTNILFQRGATFRGSLSLNNINGTAAQNVTFGAYCEGAKPVLSGLSELRQWQSLGANKWSTVCQNCPDDLNILTLQGKPLGFARFPNSDEGSRGYHYSNEFLSRTRLAADDLNGKNWVGGELVLRVQNWVLDRLKIESHNGRTISFSDENLSYDPRVNFNDAGYGFFIQNHIDAADLDGEWVWNPATKTITLYWSKGNPGNQGFAVSTEQTVINLENSSHVTFTDIAMIGANDSNFDSDVINNILLQGVESRSSNIGVFVGLVSMNIELKQLTVTDSTNRGIEMYGCGDCALLNSNIIDIGIIPGMGNSGDFGYNAVLADSLRESYTMLVENNNIDGAGYHGIYIGERVSQGITVRNNTVQGYTSVKTDGGGIYAFQTDGQRKVVIENNLVMNTAATTAGALGNQEIELGETLESKGIYMDGSASNILVHNNTVINGGDEALFLNKTAGMDIQGNTFVGSTHSGISYRDYADDLGPTLENPGLTITNNTIVQIDETRRNEGRLIQINSTFPTYDLSGLGVVNNNRYCSPYSQNQFYFNLTGQDRFASAYSPSRWQEFGFDRDSQFCDLTLSNFEETFVGPELVSESLFNSGTTGWRVNSGLAEVRHSIGFGGVMVIENGTSANTGVSTATGLGEAAEDSVYRFSFSARSNNSEEIALLTSLIRTEKPFDLAASNVNRIIPTNRFEDFTFYSNTLAEFFSDSLATNARTVNYWLTANSNYLPLVLDNVSARVVRGTFKEQDELVMVKSNSTNSNQTIRLDSNHFDLNGNLKTTGTDIVIEPNSTLVLFPE